MSATKWILLEPGDTLRLGDQYWNISMLTWLPIPGPCIGTKVVDTVVQRRMDKDATAAAEYDHETEKYRKEKP